MPHHDLRRRPPVEAVIEFNGEFWATTTAAAEWMQVDRKRINDWVRRSRAAGHVGGVATCEACAGTKVVFPHVDPPVRRGGIVGYRYSQLAKAELHTRQSARGVRRTLRPDEDRSYL